ncbi:MAG TPA: DNA replication and repair protein RecF [Candidatus Dojkabacteria bacterium]|nr:DNA replication and repair protein RecF [Candidatus Dojkabacteria bacterium]
MIKKIKIQNFRQFKNITFDFDSPIIVVSGDNTKGKSTLLEAIAVLTNGYSPWNDFSEIFSNSNTEDNFFRIEGTISNGDDHTYTFFKSLNQRILKHDDKNTNSKKFYEKISSIVFSPELIEILMISPSKRREFIDKYITVINPDYAESLKQYNKVIRHRNAYLKRLSKDLFSTGILPKYDNQLEIWSKEAAKYSSDILLKRIEFLKDLSNKDFNVEYVSSLEINDFEDLLEKDELERMYLQKYIETFKRDLALGHTTIGVHRDDWNIHTDKDIKRYGSRGEKRLSIIDMIFKINTLIKERKEYSPYLLLDDVPSELDKKNTDQILNKALKLNQQIIITTISLNYIPKEISKVAQVIDLNSY